MSAEIRYACLQETFYYATHGDCTSSWTNYCSERFAIPQCVFYYATGCQPYGFGIETCDTGPSSGMMPDDFSESYSAGPFSTMEACTAECW